MRRNKTKALFHIRSVVLLVNLMILILPLLGVFFFRFYENALVRQTEQELIAQGAVLASIYIQEIKERRLETFTYGVLAEDSSLVPIDEYYTPIEPQIDLSRDVLLPPRPEGGKGPIGSLEEKAGKALIPVIVQAQRTTLSGIKILDYKGIVVAGRNEIGQDFQTLPEIQNALRGYYTSVIRQRISDTPPPALASISRGTGIRVFIAMPIIEEGRVWGVVYLSRTPQNILKHLYAEKERVVLAAVTLVGLTLIIALLTSYMISKPLRRLIIKTEQFTKGDMDAISPLESPGVKEIELLSYSFSDMASALKKRSDYIRDFAAHVSHEFKTPITSIQGSAELLLEHKDDMEDAKKQKFLSNIMIDTNRLKHLVSRLLELARADNITELNSSCTLRDVLEDLVVHYNNTGLDITFETAPDMHIAMSEENLRAVFTNLCDNAKQHGANYLDISIKQRHDGVCLKLQDNGEGISEANQYKIFDPFFTTRRAIGGTGMGLGIVSSLLSAHGGTIILCPSDKGACFEIMLTKYRV